MADSTKCSKGYAADFLKLLIVWHGNVLASSRIKTFVKWWRLWPWPFRNRVHWIYIKTQRTTALNIFRIYILGWWFQRFLFSPLPGNMIQFDGHIFQMGWFNHQLDILFQWGDAKWSTTQFLHVEPAASTWRVGDVSDVLMWNEVTSMQMKFRRIWRNVKSSLGTVSFQRYWHWAVISCYLYVNLP